MFGRNHDPMTENEQISTRDNVKIEPARNKSNINHIFNSNNKNWCDKNEHDRWMFPSQKLCVRKYNFIVKYSKGRMRFCTCNHYTNPH